MLIEIRDARERPLSRLQLLYFYIFPFSAGNVLFCVLNCISNYRPAHYAWFSTGMSQIN